MEQDMLAGKLAEVDAQLAGVHAKLQSAAQMESAELDAAIAQTREETAQCAHALAERLRHSRAHQVGEIADLALAAASALSVVAFAAFQIFPRQIISAFGEGSELYFQFSERYFRIYMFLTIVNGIQPVTSNFFNSIGKARLGVFMSLTRQILFLLPLIIIFPIFMGIDGVMYAGPIADGITAIVCGVFTVRELKELISIDRDAHEKAVKI